MINLTTEFNCPPLRGGAVLNLLSVWVCRDVVLTRYGDRPCNDDADGAWCGGLVARRLTPDEPAAALAPLLWTHITRVHHSQCTSEYDSSS